jgi:DNA-binding NarL/FixJ family response regulator
VLKKMTPNVRIIVFTMFSESIGRSLTFAIGVDMVFSKPDGMSASVEAIDGLFSPNPAL